ncbi:chondroitin proteoglycan-2-like [Neodiprion pinetum]|uniref:chondroitin proteoglycan-2-like n=1 Tax=Neodiprion pinetum TaxID=441929 RepID=UPI00371CD4BB
MKVYVFSFLILALLAVGFGRATRCPKVDGKYAVSIPNYLNCSTFYKCNNGEAVLFECSAGLHYNAEKGVCDWPQSAGCPDPPTEPTTESSTESTTESSTESTTESSTESADVDDILAPFSVYKPPIHQATSQSAHRIFGNMKAYVYSILALAFLAVACAVECPEEDGEYVFLFENPSNCSTFYKCSQGVANLMSCSSGLEFNAELEVCDWPENANCSVAGVGEDDENDDEVVDDAEADEEDEDEEDEDEEEIGQRKKGDKGENKWIGLIRRCPKVNGVYAVSIPNYRDCRKFYKCDHGKAVPFSCPSGLLYNRNLQVCDWPQNVICRSFIKSTDVVEN